VTPDPEAPVSGQRATDDVDNGQVPSGNLFATPKLSAVDPADASERRDAERLLEALEQD
jgi:hypothetical protein